MFQKQPPEVYYKKVILKILQNLQKNTWVEVSFLIKLQVSGLQLKNLTKLLPSQFWENFKNTFCIKHHWVTASEFLSFIKYAS